MPKPKQTSALRQQDVRRGPAQQRAVRQRPGLARARGAATTARCSSTPSRTRSPISTPIRTRRTGSASSSCRRERPCILKGRFPHCRYTEFALYRPDPLGSFTATSEALTDDQIEPDEGSVNPFVPGNPRLAENRDYTIRIVAEGCAGAPRGPRAEHALRRHPGAAADVPPRLPARRRPRRDGRCRAAALRGDAPRTGPGCRPRRSANTGTSRCPRASSRA